MWGVKLPSKEPFVYSLYGVQYPDENPGSQHQNLISQFNQLITGFPAYLDELLQDGCASVASGATHLWIAYWKSCHDYHEWWTRSDVSQFWASLPENAGMWREVMTLSASRAQHGTNKTTPIGMGCLGARKSITDKSGYWGCYRHRLSASSNDKMKSPLETTWKSRARNVDLLDSLPGALNTTIRPGRVQITNLPDNLCFVVEGQDHSTITPEEKSIWFQSFDKPVTQWVKDLVSAPPDAGILDSRLCYGPESGRFRDSELPALNYNKKIQLFYFKDMRYMERIGRQNKGHVQLRNTFLSTYGPGGKLSETGQIRLWVETSVVKSKEMECEYVGCVAGTGFMDFSD